MRKSYRFLPALFVAASIVIGGCGTVAEKPAEPSQQVQATLTPTMTPAQTEKNGDEKVKKDFTVEEAAYESFTSFIDQYYFKSKVDNHGLFKKLNFWDQAEIYEIVIDAYEHTGDRRYYDMIFEIYDGFTMTHGEDFAWNEFNDDIMWITIGFTRAYKDTGDKKFLDSAVKHFKLVWDRAWSEDLEGGLFWRIENTTKNACINCPATIAACLLAEATGDESYYDKAVRIMDWVVANIYEPQTGRVYDAYEMNGNKNPWASTYNQGTFIGANNLLYLHTGDGKYLSQARRACDYTIEKMYDGGVMDNEANSGDLVGFKGILARWMYAFAVDCDQSDVMEWMKMNALTGWGNRNSKGIVGTTWNTKTSESSNIIPFSASTIVSALNNVNNECRTDYKAANGINAAEFSRCGKVIVNKKENSMTVETMDGTAFLEYAHVTFKEDCTKIVLEAAAEKDTKVEVRLGDPEGETVARGVIKAGSNETTLNAEKLSAVQRIYIVFPEKGRTVEISKINFAS